MARRVWLCDTCNGASIEMPWKCPICYKETCPNCFEIYGVCKECAKGKTTDELKELTKWDDEYYE